MCFSDDDETDLTHAELFADSARGVFIPQHFAESVNREMVFGVSDSDFADLMKGPESKWYWETWESVLNNAILHSPKNGECYLFQDGDLWIVPKEQEQEEPETDSPFSFIIEICPYEGRATVCTISGDSIIGTEYESDFLDCTGSGDAEPACDYIRSQYSISWRIVARNKSGRYENRAATAKEKEQTAREIYFDSESDFADERLAEIYLIWQAAHDVESEKESGE